MILAHMNLTVPGAHRALRAGEIIQSQREIVIINKPRVVCYTKQRLSWYAKFMKGFRFAYKCHITGKTGSVLFI